MKKAFVAILIYYLSFHFIIPEIYYLIWGDVIIYSELIDKAAANKVFWMNFVVIIAAIAVILKLPFKNHKIDPIISSNAASELFYVSIIYVFIFLIVSGGFKGVITGGMSGTVMNYLNLFLNPLVLLMCAVFLQKGKKPILFMIICYIISVTVSGSRSGILGIVLFFFYGLGFNSFTIYKKKIFTFLKYALLISPLLFVFATSLRYNDESFDWRLLSYLVIGRVSFIELGMIPVHYIDNGGLDLTLFFEKYNFIHQLKLILDSLIPGQIFDFDVMPNNYFRAIFFGFSEDFVVNNYMSINITLPVYFYAVFGYGGILVTIVFLVLYFLLFYGLKSYPFVALILISTLYEVLVYFDWVMVFNRFFTCLLTLLTLRVYMILRKSAFNILARSKNLSEEND